MISSKSKGAKALLQSLARATLPDPRLVLAGHMFRYTVVTHLVT